MMIKDAVSISSTVNKVGYPRTDSTGYYSKRYAPKPVWKQKDLDSKKPYGCSHEPAVGKHAC